MKRLDEALASCEAALGQDPHDPRALYNRRLELAELKRFDAPIRCYEAGGGARTWEALTMGCPVVAKLENSVAALAVIGVPDSVAAADEAYVALAAARAQDVAPLHPCAAGCALLSRPRPQEIRIVMPTPSTLHIARSGAPGAPAPDWRHHDSE